MSLLERTQKDMVEAMKAKEEMRLGTIRMLKAALMKFKVDNPGKELNESEEMKILNSLMKQRREAADMFRKGGREDQAAKEEAEAKLLESYMPAGASEEEIDAAIAEAMAETGATSAKQMGLVVKAAQAKLTGKRVDGKALADKVRGKLS
ncbi:MAG: GatB/YqeY domain-containing protein [Bryobacterales bacterium]|nr:GatB/YqeY domain-containing protein [Bryobacterales bacterium]